MTLYEEISAPFVCGAPPALTPPKTLLCPPSRCRGALREARGQREPGSVGAEPGCRGQTSECKCDGCETRGPQEAMKFYCDNCQAKYQIADDKVRGKILKIRCKNCNHTIVVREPHLPQAASPPALPTAAAQIQWHYALNGQTYGPYDESTLKAMFASGELTDACYIWQASFGATWKPALQVPLFLASIEQGKTRRPQFNTVGISGESQAISAEQAQPRPQDEEQGVAPTAAHEAPAQSPITSLGKGALAERLHQKTGLSPDELKSRLSGLQDRLKTHQTPAKAPVPVGLFEDSDPPQEPGDDSGFQQPKASTAAPREGGDPVVANQEKNAFRPADPVPMRSPATPLALAPESSSFDALGFEGVDAPRESVIDFSALGPAAASKDTLFDQEAPLLLGENDQSGAFQPTQSLLIQMDSIMKEGRRQRTIARSAILLVLVLVLAAGGVAVWKNSQRKEIVEEPEIVFGKQKASLTIRRYSEEERSLFRVFGKEEVITAEESKEVYEEMEREQTQAAVVPTPTPPKAPPKRPVAKAPAAPKAPEPEREKPPAAAPKPDPNSPFANLRGPSKPIYRPGSEPKAKETTSFQGTGMSKEEAQEGFRKIKKSVNYCYRKHSMRGLPLDSPKVKLTVEIQGSGKVSDLLLSPSSVQYTVFDECMKSQVPRWKFSAYGGKSIKIQHTYVLQ